MDRRIYLNQPVENPVLQCLQIKQLQSKNSTDVERFRCVFSDINNFIQSMLGTCTTTKQSEMNASLTAVSTESSCAERKAQERIIRSDQAISSARCEGQEVSHPDCALSKSLLINQDHCHP